MRKLWDKISYIGIGEKLPETDRRNVIFVNRITFILGFFVITAILINIILHSPIFIPVLSIALVFLVLIYLLTSLGYFTLAKVSLMVITLALLFYMCIRAGLGSALEYYFISLTVLPVLIFRNRSTIYFFQALCILILISQKIYVDIYRPGYPDRQIEYQVFYIVNSIYSGLLIILAIAFFHTLIHRRERELEQSNETIEAKNVQLETANKELDAFNYSVSHDIRTPLRSIDGFSRMLEMKYNSQLDEEGRELVSLIRQNTSRMRELTEDLLSFSKAGKKEIALARIDMRELLNEVLEELEDEIKRSQTHVEIGQISDAIGDVVLIKQVWLNLISNAVKYSARNENPEIKIGSEKQGDMMVYCVRDNGVGFDMRYANKLFKAFQRLHSQTEYSGTGVGLAIVQNIITRHGGQVWAEGKPKEGATFYFSLTV
jgi:signal transduction histidine kinase